ncbi:hypoxic response protein 1 [Rhizocola hellebori]|uniref:Hypoxic response protein 1 n=1 Tax=Rhizocola hellebori TaxID=1392758 RepID=A0A8J3QBZ1_9ACTN|nr:CBS domain-containing protein [Rhizocola hellebori]GIH07964.1 hypoxic response protein 1 [Rhizocola hellebori]
MTTAKQMMHLGVECVPATETLDRAAQMMREMQVGSLPICGTDNKLKGILTDRDIVIKCVAAGKDPSKLTAGELAQGEPIWVDSKADEDEVLRLMEQHLIRRVPVMEDHKLVGMISEADLAQHLSDEKLHHFVSTITQAPPTPAMAKAGGRKSKTK